MDKTKLVAEVAHLFSVSGHDVQTDVTINHRRIDIRAEERQGLVRKIILVECADYSIPVGVAKVQEDISKLEAARESLGSRAVIMLVSRMGYSPEGSGYANDKGVTISTFASLQGYLVNFSGYIDAVRSDPQRAMILREYQEPSIHFDRGDKRRGKAITFLRDWLGTDERWLTVLGDYGVGKSWMLKRLLYDLVEAYSEDPLQNPLPLFVPLQSFTKSFDYPNMLLRVFHSYGLSGVHLDAFNYLAHEGRIIFLFDSFDEMAQHLSRNTIRENLTELLSGVAGNSKAIMTSRPNYFESRFEHLLLVEREGGLEWHELDEQEAKHQNALARFLSDKYLSSSFARLEDLSLSQRKKLFQIVLGHDTNAYKKLVSLLNQFQELKGLSQRAVIARLLTTVAETLSRDEVVTTVEGYPLIPDSLRNLNEAKIFEIVIYNLLHRDLNIGSLKVGDRLKFLRAFALMLQQRGSERFATPDEMRGLVRNLFQDLLVRSDSPETMLESYYRTCRRHSGLTTEKQFLDTSGQIDIPVDESDTTSRVGFSHNSLREYLVADALSVFVRDGDGDPDNIAGLVISEVVGQFFRDLTEYDEELLGKLSTRYADPDYVKVRQQMFFLARSFFQREATSLRRVLGDPPLLSELDLSSEDLSSLDLSEARINDCLVLDTDFRGGVLSATNFDGCILEGVLLDGAKVDGANFRESEIISIYVFDPYVTNTSLTLTGRAAEQWLFTEGALVRNPESLNPHLGKPWYTAAREVTRTLKRRIAGTHQDIALPKGTSLKLRPFAEEFVEFLIKRGLLMVVMKDRGKRIVKVAPAARGALDEFSENGVIGEELAPFFEERLPRL